jgi:hypothetical protein
MDEDLQAMSRILMVSNDDRKVPAHACWWRLRLRKNDDGVVYMSQYHIPEDRLPWDGKWIPWSGHVDYFDGRNDWSWPFAQTVTMETKSNPVASDYPELMIITGQTYYLDVLDVTPPDSTESSQWLQLTPPVDQAHPGRLRSKLGVFWPRGRQHWLQAPEPQYYWQSIDYPRSMPIYRMT